jgi:hypothetical protein
MRFGPRLIREVLNSLPGEAEEASLLAALNACPGVSSVQSVRAHHKGGFAAVIDIDEDRFDDYVEHMKSHGWMNVI